MKKGVIIFTAIAALIASFSFGASMNFALSANQTVGLGLPNYGWAMKNAEGQTTGFQGFNLSVGYSAKYFFSPLKANSWTPFWEWGTALLIIPTYLGVGADYVGADGIYFEVKMDDLFPSVGIGVVY